MRVTRGLTAGGGPTALTIGNFDGVHLGHQAILEHLIELARADGLVATLLTFEPHPREFFTPQQAPTRLTSLREKIELLRDVGLQRVHLCRFDHAFAALSADAFMQRVLVDVLQVKHVLIGDDFRFGAGRAGDLDLLRGAADRLGFSVGDMATIKRAGARVSSSAIRHALATGDLPRAAFLLGRHYSIAGRVVHGDKLGRQLGFATANVQMRHNRPPLTGIFAVEVVGIAQRAWPGVASLGYRPTVKAAGAPTLEVHLFDFATEIYGRHLRVDFLHKIRDEEHYPDLASLTAQIACDVAAARSLLGA